MNKVSITERVNGYRASIYRTGAQIFGWLLWAQWVALCLVTWVFTPQTWIGESPSMHVHMLASIGLGALLVSLPAYLCAKRPDWAGTRHAVAVAQMGLSAILIHVLGGRIEAHFYVFSSLAFIGFFRCWKTLVTATLFVAVEHIARGIWAPMSIFGVSEGSFLRPLEHAVYVIVEVAVLIGSCRVQEKEWQMRAESDALVSKSQEESRKASEEADRLLGRLTGEIGGLAQTLASSSTQVSTTTKGLAESMAEASRSSAEASESSDESSRLVGKLSETSTCLESSMREISTGTQSAIQIATEAREHASNASLVMDKLAESSSEIFTVLSTISDIADQTNMLALNATIESARAGEHGKGFAVVAGEVKALAQQTTNATNEISERVHAMQEDSSRAITAMGRITEIVKAFGEIQEGIASNVESQSASVTDNQDKAELVIELNAQLAARVGEIVRFSQSNEEELVGLSSMSTELSRLSGDLADLVVETSQSS